MTAQELAAKLNGRQYLDEMTKEEKAQARADGLVVVYGASDDLMEFEGAIDDEIGASIGIAAFLDSRGLLPSFIDLCDNKDWRGLQDYFRRFDGRKEIEAKWDHDGYSWTYTTDIPHATFEIMEEGEKYCRGIVFRLADCAA